MGFDTVRGVRVLVVSARRRATPCARSMSQGRSCHYFIRPGSRVDEEQDGGLVAEPRVGGELSNPSWMKEARALIGVSTNLWVPLFVPDPVDGVVGAVTWAIHQSKKHFNVAR